MKTVLVIGTILLTQATQTTVLFGAHDRRPSSGRNFQAETILHCPSVSIELGIRSYDWLHLPKIASPNDRKFFALLGASR